MCRTKNQILSSSDEDGDKEKSGNDAEVPAKKHKKESPSDSSCQEESTTRRPLPNVEDVKKRPCRVDITAFSSKLLNVLEQKGKVRILGIGNFCILLTTLKCQQYHNEIFIFS